MDGPTVKEKELAVLYMQYSSRAAALALSMLFLVASTGLVSCKPRQEAPPPPPPQEVSVIKIVASPVTLSTEYVAQAEAKDTVEIRARVSGILVEQKFEDGAHVAAGQTLYVIDQEPYKAALAQAKAALAQAEASHLNARQNLDRVKPLAEAKAVSKQDLDAAVAGEHAAGAQADAAEAGVTQAELNLEYTTVRAPMAGVTSSSLVRPGSLVVIAVTQMATLYSVDPMYINTTISETRMLELTRQYGGGLGKGAATGPSVKVLMVDGSVYPHAARINYFGAAVDKQTGTLAVRVSVPNPGGLLKPGQFVRLVFPETTIMDGIKVPLQAVQQMQEVKTVLVVGPDGAAEPRQIKGDRQLGNDLVVDEGLKPGDTIIVEGTAKVRPGAKVKPVPMGSKQEKDEAGGAAPKKAAH